MRSQAVVLLQGICALACWAIGLVFLRFWRESRDRLFAYFAIGFALMCLTWALLGLGEVAADHRPYIYVLRLVAFVLIIAAIIDKNRTSGSP